ncbi:hypothetical protein ACIGXM_23770 [Kitasatospora sp. NPDC052896]|uniref:hypothetical protein n=1 Tax=Kitasatospora sp. NPDC052896 TaxID=3364061 RepID=UPI0037C5795B
MGFFDRLRSKTDEVLEHAKAGLGGHHQQASDAMGSAGQKAAERMPGPAADAMGNATHKAQDMGQDEIEQAAHDMESEGGPDPEK